METDLNFWLQLAVMLVCIGVGGRFGGVGLGAAGGLGVSILVFGLRSSTGITPCFHPIDYCGCDCLYQYLARCGRSRSLGPLS